MEETRTGSEISILFSGKCIKLARAQEFHFFMFVFWTILPRDQDS